MKTNPCQKMTLVSVIIFVFLLSLLATYPQAMAQNSSPNRDINTVLAAHDKELLAIPDVVGVYVGTIGNERQLCLKVMLARANPESERKIPPMIEGYRVVTAADGRDALQQLQSHEQPSLILLDLMMPGMDGEQFMNAFRRGAYAKIPVVIMSGHCEAERKVIELNANCSLMKPVEYDDLITVVHRLAPAGQVAVETSKRRDRKE